MWILAKTYHRPWWTLLLLSLALSTLNSSFADAKHTKHVHHNRRLTKKTSKKAKKEQAPTASKASKLVASVGSNIAPAPVMLLLPVIPTPVPSMQDTSRQPVIRPTNMPVRRGRGGGTAAAPATTTVTLDFDNPIITNANAYEGFAFTAPLGITIDDCRLGCTAVVNSFLLSARSAITITQTNGNPFSLNSFQTWNQGSDLTISGIDSTGAATPTVAVTIDNTDTFQTVILGAAYASVTSVTLTPALVGGFIPLENVSVTY